MSKNKEMLQCFFKVIIQSETEENLVIPKMYAADIYSINYNKLLTLDIKNLIFDIDNTILPVNDLFVPNQLLTFIKKLKDKGFNICIVSNNKKARVLSVARKLAVNYLYKANKPKKEAYDKSLELLKASKKTTAMIGDQMLSDIKGANENGIYSILVEPFSNKYDIKTGTSRILQNIMIKRLEKRKKFKRNKYY